MPYIPTSLRKEVNREGPWSPGELNYWITNELLEYLARRASLDNGQGYAHYSEVVGVLECVKQEFIRRILNPYEDKKIKENGDVF